jgi:hypothetical protein
MLYKKILLLFVLFSSLAITTMAQEQVILSKTKKNGNEKTKTIKLNQKVKVFYISKDRLSSSDRPPFMLYKKKIGNDYIGMADGKLIEINEEFLLIQRTITKDLITVPVNNIIALGKYNSFKRIGTLIVASLGTAFILDSFLENNLGIGYETTILLGSFLVVGPIVINAIDKTLFPAHKLNPKQTGYKLSIH